MVYWCAAREPELVNAYETAEVLDQAWLFDGFWGGLI